jgi:ribosomal protein S18 acetylase RimI-like enzyme
MAPVVVCRYQRALADPLEQPRWAPGFGIIPFEPAQHALLVHRLLQPGYAARGEALANPADWWTALATDPEYDPGLVLVAGDRSHTPCAVAICWTSAFVKDLAVTVSLRRRGLATSLLHHAFCIFRDRGAEAVALKVRADNHAAIALYRSAGMVCVETLSDSE